MRAALEQPVPLEGDEVVMDRRGRGQADRIGDLADRRRIAALRDGAGDALEDLLLALCVVPGQGRLSLGRVVVRS